MPETKKRIDLEGGMGSRLFPSLAPNQSSSRIDLEGGSGAGDTAQLQPKQSLWDYLKGNVADNQAYGGFRRKYRPVQSVPPTNQGPGIFQKLYEMMQGLDNNINDPSLLAGLTGPHGRVQLKSQAIDPALVANQLMGNSTPIINAAVDPAKKLKLASK